LELGLPAGLVWESACKYNCRKVMLGFTAPSSVSDASER
ncbi:uncharacterized protein METZ01_LOCUS514265, partial [marine metagenome]